MISHQQQHQPPTTTTIGTLDGDGAADHDLPYRFGRKPSVRAPFPSSTHQYARLLILRSRVHAATPIRPSLSFRLSHQESMPYLPIPTSCPHWPAVIAKTSCATRLALAPPDSSPAPPTADRAK